MIYDINNSENIEDTVVTVVTLVKDEPDRILFEKTKLEVIPIPGTVVILVTECTA